MLHRPFTILSLAILTGAAFAGDLTPPAGPIAPTHKTLTQVEPRIPISSTNTPGDTDSVYRISQAGSYYLTGNLLVPTGKSGIEIATGNVAIDLNGFTITSLSSLTAIRLSVGGRTNITIRNGFIGVIGGGGIDLKPDINGAVITSGGLIENVHVTGTNGTGIHVGNAFTIVNCSATNNSEYGFRAESGCTFRDCTARDNGFTGIFAAEGAAIHGCTAIGNQTGISTSFQSTIIGCTTKNNNYSGIYAGNGSTVVNCTSTYNGRDGILALSHCVIRHNNCNFNGTNPEGGAGIQTQSVGFENRIEGNTCARNTRGIYIRHSGNILIGNICSANSMANWDVASGNHCLVIDAASSGAILGNSGGASLSTNPFANFTH